MTTIQDIKHLQSAAGHLLKAIEALSGVDNPNLRSDAIWVCVRALTHHHSNMGGMTEEQLNGTERAALQIFKSVVAKGEQQGVGRLNVAGLPREHTAEDDCSHPITEVVRHRFEMVTACTVCGEILTKGGE